jgi:hypothetical protein
MRSVLIFLNLRWLMMSRQVPAFTLLELMIYTTLVSLLALAAGGFCSTIYSSLIALQRPAITTLETEIVLDVIARDLMSAVPHQTQWDVSQFVMTCERLDASYAPVRVQVGWEKTDLANGKSGVRRSEGVYNFHTHRWTKRGISIIGCDIRTLSLVAVLNRDQPLIKRVRIRYERGIGMALCERMVKIRSRILS